jgi:glycine/D-amino acid oxidase-like deaminating enzyme
MNLKSGYPYSLVKHGLPVDYPRLEKSIKTEVVVMGGGISGSLAAYRLQKAGIQCTIVEGRTVGLGSTCSSTSLLQYEIDVSLHHLIDQIGHSHAVRAYHLCAEAIDTLAGLARSIKMDDFRYQKSLYYAAYKKHRSFIEKEYAARKKNGFKVFLLNEEQVADDFGFYAPAAILSNQGAQTNAYLYTHALLKSFKKSGGEVYDRTVVTAIEPSQSGVKLTTDRGYIIQCKKLVIATGYEAAAWVDKKIVDFKSTFAVISEQFNGEVPALINKALIWNTADPYLYFRTTQDRRIIIGGRDENFYDPVKRDKLLKRKSALLAKDFAKIFPSLEFNPEFSWAGTFGATKDGLPYIGSYPKMQNCYFALGFGGNGITFSSIAADIITDLITGKKNKDAAIFSFDRA